MRQSPLFARRTSRLKIIGFPSSRSLEGAQHIQHAVALKTPFASEIRCRFAEDALDAARLPDQLRVPAHEHRCCATHVRRSHARAVELAPLTIQQARLNALAWRYQVGLHPSITRWSATRE